MVINVERYYFDTAIWIDYYENRSDRFRPLGDWAHQLIGNILEKRDTILYSEMLIKELETLYTKESIEKIFEFVKMADILLKVNISKNQLEKAAILSKQRNVPFGDVLHALLAQDNNAIMVTRDKHFMELLDIVEVKKPEDLI